MPGAADLLLAVLLIALAPPPSSAYIIHRRPPWKNLAVAGGRRAGALSLSSSQLRATDVDSEAAAGEVVMGHPPPSDGGGIDDRTRLARSVGRAASLLLRDGATPDAAAFAKVTDEVLDMLVPGEEAGRASVWSIDTASGAFRLAATSARGESEDASSLDNELDFDHLAFLRSLVRGGDGLFRTKQEMDDRVVPNKPGYDQLMFGACVNRGIFVALLGVGRKFGVGGSDTSCGPVDGGWEAPHLASVQAVADMLRMPFLHAHAFDSEEADDGDDDVEFFATSNSEKNFMTEEALQSARHERISQILGDAAKRLGPHGLLGLSVWEYDDGALMLEPGRRTRRSAGRGEPFSEAPIDVCETIIEDVKKIIFPLAHVADCIDLDWDDGVHDVIDETNEMAKLKEWMAQDMQYCNRPSAERREVKFVGMESPVRVEREFAVRIGGLGDDERESSDRSRIILMPVMARGCLRSVLSFTLDANFAKDKAHIDAVLQCGVQTRKQLMALHWEHRILRSSTEVPDMSDLIEEIRAGNAVALTGAGFSLPAGLMNWANLLSALLESAIVTASVDSQQYDFIAGLITERTADAFDQAAQSLEDVLGEERMQTEIGELLAIDFDGMPRTMQRRVRAFMDIPWRAVLTTNYDMCLSGPTPQCPDVGKSYVRALRTGVASIGDHLIENAPDTPVIKLHGCVQRGNIVFTRSGYRKLLYRASGYRVFLQSMMASHTLVSLGHSGTDAYLNEMNSELLTMFGKSDLPLRYSIAPASEGMASFARRYDGLNFLSWDQERHGWGVFDHLLQTLRCTTSPRARMRAMLRGRRILLVESTNANPIGWKLVELASLLFDILPSANVHLLESPEHLQAAVVHAADNVAPYDVVLLVYDKQSTQTALEANRLAAADHNLPIAVVESDCPGTRRGILRLKDSIRIIRTKADAAELLFALFEQDEKLHQ